MLYRKGYTMIELVVVLAVMGILAATVVVNIANITEMFKLNITARQIAADLRWTEQAAVTEQTRYFVEFSRYGDFYIISRYNPITNTYVAKKIVRMPTTVDLIGTNYAQDRVIYNTIGGVSGVRGGYITIIGKGRYRYIVIAAVTGRVRIDEKMPAY